MREFTEYQKRQLQIIARRNRITMGLFALAMFILAGVQLFTLLHG